LPGQQADSPDEEELAVGCVAEAPEEGVEVCGDPEGLYIVTGAVGLDDRASISLLVVVFWHQNQDFVPRLRIGRNVSQLAFDLFFSCSPQQNESADLNLCSIRPRIGQHLMKVTSVLPGTQLL
jgi:hypothetical protein